MDHLPMARLMELRAEAVILDPNEAEHLKQCVECRTILRKLAEERSRDLIQKKDVARKSA
jgi:predicted anti-sigma-YlaC factor YlaD